MAKNLRTHLYHPLEDRGKWRALYAAQLGLSPLEINKFIRAKYGFSSVNAPPDRGILHDQIL